MLTVLRLSYEDGIRKWKCLCECGRIVTSKVEALKSGATTSCGCLRTARLLKMNTTHRDNNTPEHKTWRRMISRCECKNTPYYKHYGARGIKICSRWRNDYLSFLKDMGRKPSPSHELDRIDNDGNYEPGNCRWATRKQQTRNMRITRKITIDGETKSIADWSDISGIHSTTIKSRLKIGMSPKEAVFTKKFGKIRRKSKARLSSRYEELCQESLENGGW